MTVGMEASTYDGQCTGGLGQDLFGLRHVVQHDEGPWLILNLQHKSIQNFNKPFPQSTPVNTASNHVITRIVFKSPLLKCLLALSPPCHHCSGGTSFTEIFQPKLPKSISKDRSLCFGVVQYTQIHQLSMKPEPLTQDPVNSNSLMAR